MREVTPAIRASLKGFEPSDEQWDAIDHASEPLAVIAGAGAGKTAIMAARMVWMVESGIRRPSQILGLTFSNKAALELEERIVEAFGAMDPPPSEHPLIATYNSFADKLVREHGVRVGIDPEVGLLTEAQSWQLLLEQFDDLPPFEAIESRSSATLVRYALQLYGACADHIVSPERIIEEDRRIVEEAEKFDEDVVRTSRQRVELAALVRSYIDAKRRSGWIDFGDQVMQAVGILERFPSVARELRERYPALLLDEYQDTNVAQRRLLQLLAPGSSHVTAVGDARQNIYQWRGSTLFNLIDFPRHFPRASGEDYAYLSLSENYRSGSRILAVANRIIEPVPAERRPGKPLTAHSRNHEGSVVAKVTGDQYAEAAFVAEEILRLHGTPMHSDREPTSWSDFAILVRRRSHIGPIYMALKQREIPVEVVGLSGLLQVPEVVDTIAWLRILSDPGPGSNRWLARILLGPRFRVHYRDLAILARWATRHNLELAEKKREKPLPAEVTIPNETELEPDAVAFSLTEALDHIDEIEELPPEARRRLVLAHSEIRRLRPKASGSLLELVQSVMIESGIVEALDASTREDAESSRRNLGSFLGVVGSFSPVSKEPSLAAFLSYLDAAEEVEETLDLATPVGSDSVKLMTVHQAKGLEFEVVFVPGVSARTNEEGEKAHSIFPDIRTTNPMRSYSSLPPTVREDAVHLPSPWKIGPTGERVAKTKAAFARELTERAIEDERRLFYVALTRAKQRLYVTASLWYERQKEKRGPSQFFDEVAACPECDVMEADAAPDENPLIEALEKKAVWPPEPARLVVPSDLFPEGYPSTVEKLIAGELSEEDLLAKLGKNRSDAVPMLAEYDRILASILEARPQPDSGGLGALSATAAAGLLNERVDLADLVRPLPEKPSAARRIGTEIHRWIEEKARGLSGLADEDAVDAPSVHVPRSRLGELKGAFDEMAFGEKKLATLPGGEPMAEVPFLLKAGELLIRGRIDAVYEAEDGSLEIVDFKTGAEVESAQIDQLMIYACALHRMGLDHKGPFTLTYCYLASRKTVSRTVSLQEVEGACGRLDLLGAEVGSQALSLTS